MLSIREHVGQRTAPSTRKEAFASVRYTVVNLASPFRYREFEVGNAGRLNAAYARAPGKAVWPVPSRGSVALESFRVGFGLNVQRLALDDAVMGNKAPSSRELR